MVNWEVLEIDSDAIWLRVYHSVIAMARNSRSKSKAKGRNKQNSRNRPSKAKSKDRTMQDTNELDLELLSMEDEDGMRTPEHSKIPIQLIEKPNFSDWLTKVQNKHPIARMSQAEEITNQVYQQPEQLGNQENYNGVRSNSQTTVDVHQGNRGEYVEEVGQKQNSQNHQKGETGSKVGDFSWQQSTSGEDYTAQTIHCAVSPKSEADPFNCTFIYAFNTTVERQSLWQSLKEYAKQHPGPWLIMGDINCVINMEERLGSQDYKERIQQCWDKEVKGSECTKWWQKLKAVKNSLKELNRRSFSNIQAETE
ncbi:Segregation and condensation protein B-like protein [Bienertia sinuspersici]